MQVMYLEKKVLKLHSVVGDLLPISFPKLKIEFKLLMNLVFTKSHEVPLTLDRVGENWELE